MEHNIIDYIALATGGLVTLLSVIVGGGITYITTNMINKKNRKAEAESLLNAIKSEIKTALIIIKERGYLELLDSSIPLFPSIKDLGDYIKSNNHIPTMIVDKHDIYNIIYKNNISKIGLIDKNIAIKIVQFYGLVEAILLDFIPTSPHNTNGVVKELLIEDSNLLVQAVILGQEIIEEELIDHNQVNKFLSYTN